MDFCNAKDDRCESVENERGSTMSSSTRHYVVCSCVIKGIVFEYPACKRICEKFGAGTKAKP
jgi:hypothetical protein